MSDAGARPPRRSELRWAAILATGFVSFGAGFAGVGEAVTVSSARLFVVPSSPTNDTAVLSVRFCGLPVYQETVTGTRALTARTVRVTELSVLAAFVAGMVQALLVAWVADRLYGALTRPADPEEAA